MLSSLMADQPFDPNRRGSHAAYREHEVNRCPGCGRSNWLIGRLMAECAFCTTALPLSSALTRGTDQPVAIRFRDRRR